jgi:ABC-2 type transport system permease protein
MRDKNRVQEVMKYVRIYWLYFQQYWKSRLIYKTDFALGFVGQAISLGTSLAFLTLIFTQVETLQGWTYNEMLFLAGLGGMIMNLHHIFLFNIFYLGEDYIVEGKMDRFLVRPLSPLFQVYADSVSDNNLSKFIINIALIVYAGLQIGINVTPVMILYGLAATVSGVLVFGATYLLFASTAFWTGKSKSAIWLIFRVSDFRRYPFSIYGFAIQAILVTLIPLAFASFFPATFFLGKEGWTNLQILSIIAGPVYYGLSYGFWMYGLSNYSSTGS